MSFTNKVVIVTGSSSGIGATAAIQFAKEGADVVIVGRNEEKLAKVEEQCSKVGKKPLVIKADISKDDEAINLVQKTIETYGKLDVLINNAGISRCASILSGNLLKVYDEITPTNVRAVVHLTGLAAPHLIKTQGNIVNISSVGGTMNPSPIAQVYCMNKAALNHFTRGAALELAQHGVRVNVISPGPVKTDIIDNDPTFPGTWDTFKAMTALNRVAEPEEIADLILYLASDKAQSVTGSNYFADSGIALKR